MTSDPIKEAERIKDRLRQCKTAPDVEAVADEERDAVKAMHNAGGESLTMAIQITNLKVYQLRQLAKASKRRA